MSGQDDTNTTGTATHKDDRFVLTGSNPAKEPSPTYENIPAAPPLDAIKAPNINVSQQEWRWTGGPRNQPERDRINRFRINLRPAKDHQIDPEQNAEEVGNCEKSRMARLELVIRLISWFVALGALSSAVYVSVHVKSQRTPAVFGQLAVSVSLRTSQPSLLLCCLTLQRGSLRYFLTRSRYSGSQLTN